MDSLPRVVLLAFDGLPLACLRPSVMPNLMRLAVGGGIAPGGGRSNFPSTTYPGFASLLTGAAPVRTGIRTTSSQAGAVPGWAGTDRCQVPTLIHVAKGAGLRVGAVMGDHKLQRVLMLDEIDEVWPPRATVPTGTELDAHGYPTNAAIRDRVVEAALDPDLDLVFVHLNETDTLGHDLGPTAPETVRCARQADAIVGEMVEALAPDWDRTLIAVASDHDMSTRLPLPPIDPTSAHECAGLIDDWIPDGAAAWIRLMPGADTHMAIKHLGCLDGVEAWRWRKPNMLLLLAQPGRTFAAPWIPDAGIHGSLCTGRTVAIVGGGHPDVGAIAESLEARAPKLQDWAPTLADVLGIELPAADGFDMLGACSELQPAG